MTLIRRPAVALLVAVRIATTLVLPARAGADDDMLAAVMRASGFSELHEEIALTGSVYMRPVTDVARVLFDHRIGLAAHERDALLLALLNYADRMEPRVERAVTFVVLDRLALVDDWTLIAEILERTDADDFGGRESTEAALMLLSVGERMLREIEERPGVGHARAARALGSAVGTRAASIAAGPAGIAVVLAETLRSIARMLRDEQGVRALRDASRALLVRRTE